MATVPKRLRELLDHYQLRWRVVQAMLGLLMALCAIVAGVGLCVLVDRLLLGAPRGVRWAFLIAIAVIVAALLVRRVFAPALKRMRDENTAVSLGRNFPNMAEDLVTGVELSRDEDSYGVSKGLVDAALSQIDQRSATVSWRQAVPLDRLKRIFSVFAILGIAMGMAYVFMPEAIRDGLKRFINPNTEKFFSYTDLKVLPGDAVRRSGDTMLVEFTAHDPRRRVTRATLEVSPASGESFTSEVAVRPDGAGAWQSGPLLGDLSYRVKAGDCITPQDHWYTVHIYPAPAFAARIVSVTPPAYTTRGEKAFENVGGPLTVLCGPPITRPGQERAPQPSTVVIKVRPAPRGDDPRLVCSATITDGSQTWPMTAEGSLLVSPKLTPTQDVDYKITLKDGFDLTSRAPETVSIKIVADDLPVVIVPDPGMDVRVVPNSKVFVTVSATDDWGIRAVGLQYRIVRVNTPPDAPPPDWKTLPIADGNPNQLQLQGSLEMAVGDYNAAPGDRIDIQGIASDYADEAMFRPGKSAIYRISIISLHADVTNDLTDLGHIADDIARLAKAQMAESKKTGELAKAPAKDDKSQDAANGQQNEDQLRQKVKDAENELAKVTNKLIANPLTPSSLVADLSKTQARIDDTEAKEMKTSSDQLGKASESKPGKPSDSQQQQKNLSDAKDNQKTAADKLADIAKDLARIQRRKLLDILADEADHLSGDQKDERDMTGNLAAALTGKTASELQQAELDRVMRVAGFQKKIAEGIATLGKEIEKALNELTQEKAPEADKATDALDEMQSARLTERSDEVASQIGENNLFAQTGPQLMIANSLTDVAKKLRTLNPDQIDKELQEFIKKQKEYNARMEKLIGGDLKGADPAEPSPKTTPAALETGAMNNVAPMPNMVFAVAGAGMQPPAQIHMVLALAGPGGPGAMNMVFAAVGDGKPVQIRPAPEKSAQPAAKPAAAQMDDVDEEDDEAAPAEPPPAAAASVRPEVKAVAGRIGERQGLLEQSVNESSLAMRNLFKELGLFKLETADKLDQASTEMGLAAQDLPVPSLPPALDHGRKALALLEEAAKKLPADQKPSDQPPKDPDQMSLEDMMLLAKIIGQMKMLHADTASADKVRLVSAESFPERVMDLARRQGRIRYDTTKLTRRLLERQQAKPAQAVELAGGKMDISHSSLESGDAGQETRVVQKEAIEILELLLKDQSGGGGGGGGGGSQMMAAIQRMAQGEGAGSNPGGNHGGSNADIAPANTGEAGFKIDSQTTDVKDLNKSFMGAESDVPTDFRSLWDAYARQIQKESRR